VLLTGGQAGDNPQLLPLLGAVRVPRLGPGRARTRVGHLIADRAYSHHSTRAALRARRIPHTIPERSDQQALRARHGQRGGRPPAFNADIYRHRNVVERGINRLKQWRGIATRYDKKASHYRSGILLGALILWTRA
jgi:transposase